MEFILIYTTYKNRADAEVIVDHLLNKKMIACANFFPITSRYRWKGGIESEDEVVALLKTRKENWQKVKEYIESKHNYETPCVIKLTEVESNDSYADWIQEETNA